jgi:FAD-dependent urate hydroxylase
MEATLRSPGWFRRLPTAQRESIERRFWEEGRLKLEPWLTPRLARPQIRRFHNSTVTGSSEVVGGPIAARLSGGEVQHADHIILATGYQADIKRVPYLAGVLDKIETAQGFPILDEHFQTSVPGLFITGFAATRDFGPFFGFVRGSTTAATIIARGLVESASRLNGDGAARRRRERHGIVRRHTDTAGRARALRRTASSGTTRPHS